MDYQDDRDLELEDERYETEQNYYDLDRDGSGEIEDYFDNEMTDAMSFDEYCKFVERSLFTFGTKEYEAYVEWTNEKKPNEY